ncbi:carbohydrate binding domain protein [Paraburkholderia xenovorans LB400]|nr:trypsin-like peptidase domain-containing protein [Paraburkholderia xenovorans]AIP34199.1 carbohydrate binding domain protein [Paraburkholderia xenovorans LB400]
MSKRNNAGLVRLTLIAGAVVALLHNGTSFAGSSVDAGAADNEPASTRQNDESTAKRKNYNLDLLPQQPSDLIYLTTVTEPDSLYLKLTFDRASLPAGGYVQISNGASQDVATYRAEDLLTGPVTVRGDTAVIRTVLPRLRVLGELHLSHVDYGKPAVNASVRALIGNDERRQRACYVGTDMYRYSLPAVVAMGSGSGSVVGNGRYLLTNQHVTLGVAGKTESRGIELNYFRNSCDTTSEPNDPLRIRTDRIVAIGDGGSTDYSLVSLNDFDVQHAHTKELFGSARIRPLGDNALGDEIYIPQYGNGGLMPQVIGDLFEGKHAAVTSVGTTIKYNADTQSGSSGSPVLSRATNEIIALHYAGSDSANYGVRLTTLHKNVLPFIERENDNIVGEGNVKSVALVIPPFVLGKSVGTIASGAIVAPFPDVRMTHHGAYSEALLDSQDELTLDLGAVRYQLYFQGPAGAHDLSSQAVAGDELFIRLVPPATPSTTLSTSLAWLPLKVTDARGTLLENLIVRVENSEYDPFTVPFDASSPDVTRLSFDIANAKKDYMLDSRFDGEQYGYVALYPGEGPAQLVGSTTEPYASIQLPLKNQMGRAEVVRLRGYRATACSRRAMQSTIGCASGEYSTLRLEYLAADNPNLSAGTYDGFLPLQAQRSSATSRKILAEVHLKVASDALPVANVGESARTVVASSVEQTYALDGTGSRDPADEKLTYKWRVASGSFGIRNADQAKAQAVVPKNATGEGVYELTVTNESGKTAKATVKVTAVAPQVTISGGTQQVKDNEQASYSANANFDGATYSWKLSSAAGKQAATGSGAQWKTPVGLDAGTYTVSLDARNGAGDRSASAQQKLTVERTVALPGPEANAGADRTVVATNDTGFAYPLVGSASRDPNGQAITYQWRVVSGPFTLRNGDRADAEAIVPKGTTGTGVFELKVTNAAGKTATATTKVTAIAPAVTLTGSTTVTGSGAASYKANANFEEATYSWTLTDTSGQQVVSGSGADWNLSADVKNGNYTLKVLASSVKGQRSATATLALKVERAVAPKPVEAKISGPVEIRAGTTIELSGAQSVNPNGTPTTYLWTVPPQLGSNAETPSVRLTAPANATVGAQYTIKLSVYDTQNKLSSTASYTVTVKAGETPAGPAYPAYKAGTEYKAGELVLNYGQLYQCKPFPYAGWCSQAPPAYEPGKGWAWTDAWIKK